MTEIGREWMMKVTILEAITDYENEQIVLNHPEKMFPAVGYYVSCNDYEALQDGIFKIMALSEHQDTINAISDLLTGDKK